jgi:hypothetical protein
MTRVAWIGDGEPRMKVAHVEATAGGLRAHGTRMGEQR